MSKPDLNRIFPLKIAMLAYTVVAPIGFTVSLFVYGFDGPNQGWAWGYAVNGLVFLMPWLAGWSVYFKKRKQILGK